jgi:exportin-1
MACDTFIIIARCCKRNMSVLQQDDHEPFIDEIIRNLDKITNDLSPSQIHTFYEACGLIVGHVPSSSSQARMLASLMAAPNSAWDSIVTQARDDPGVLTRTDTIKMLGSVLKTNVAVCVSVGGGFLPQLSRIYLDMLALYRSSSQLISNTIATEGPIATRTPRVRGLRTIKKEVLKLVEAYINHADDLDQVNSALIPPLLEAVLVDYNQNLPEARDHEVLDTMTAIIRKLGVISPPCSLLILLQGRITEQVPAIMSSVFACTLDMINKDMAEYPEHRVSFFKMIQAINMNCFPALLQLPASDFSLFLDSIVWAFKHTMRDVADTGLVVCLELVNNFAASDVESSNTFFQQHYIRLLQDVFVVLTDTEHKAGTGL